MRFLCNLFGAAFYFEAVVNAFRRKLCEKINSLEETNEAEQNRLKVEKQLFMMNLNKFKKSERIAVTCAYYL